MTTALPEGSSSARRAPTARRAFPPPARVFSDVSYGAASVRDLVRGTELAGGTFSNEFPTRRRVLRALVDEIVVEARALVGAFMHLRLR